MWTHCQLNQINHVIIVNNSYTIKFENIKFRWETLKQVTHGRNKSFLLHQWPSCTYAYCQETQNELERGF